MYFGGHFEKSALTALPRMGIFADNLISTCLQISFQKKVVSKNPPGGACFRLLACSLFNGHAKYKCLYFRQMIISRLFTLVLTEEVVLRRGLSSFKYKRMQSYASYGLGLFSFQKAIICTNNKTKSD